VGNFYLRKGGKNKNRKVRTVRRMSFNHHKEGNERYDNGNGNTIKTIYNI
jgi:hypothetical protein